METPTIDETTDIKWEIVAPDYAATVVTTTEADLERAVERATEPEQPAPEPERFPYPAPMDGMTDEELAQVGRDLDEYVEDCMQPRTTHRDWSLYLAHLINEASAYIGLGNSHFVRQLHRVRWAMDHCFDQAVLDVAEKEEKIAEMAEENDDLQERIKSHNQSLETVYTSVDEVKDNLDGMLDKLEDLSFNEIKSQLEEAGGDLEKALNNDWPEDL